MLLNKSTIKSQEKLAEYCRTGTLQYIEGVTENRIHHYRRLIFNIALDTLTTGYPITSNLIGQESWRNLVSEFYKNSQCTSPYVWKMPLDFFEFTKSNTLLSSFKSTYPFIEELLHFELIELEMYMMEDIALDKVEKEGSFIDNKIVLHPESKIIKLDYPVHLKPPNMIHDEDKAEYYCLCFREPKDRKIMFFNLSPLFAYTIEQIYNGHKLPEIISSLEDNVQASYEEIEKNIISFLENMKKQNFILGFS